MIINFDSVVPHPIRDIYSSESDIWNNNIVFEQGKFYQISAASGVGKTTFLNLIYGSRKDYDGSVFINQKNLNNLSFTDWSKLRTRSVSMVFQGLFLFDNLTVFQNIMLKNRLTNHKTEDQIMDMINQLGIGELKDKIVAKISFGQKQRVAIVRALCQPYQVILLDEPFSHLDTSSAQIALQLIIESSMENHATILLTSLSETLVSDNFSLIKL